MTYRNFLLSIPKVNTTRFKVMIQELLANYQPGGEYFLFHHRGHVVFATLVISTSSNKYASSKGLILVNSFSVGEFDFTSGFGDAKVNLDQLDAIMHGALDPIGPVMQA